MIKTRTNKTRTIRSTIIIGMFFVHSLATAGWAGELVAWGSDLYGRVSDTPTGNDFVAVSAGGIHSVALKIDGSLIAWGYDGHGQVSNTPTGNDFLSVKSGAAHSVALKTDGSLVAWGSDTNEQVSNTPVGNDFIAIGAGHYHNVALKTDGSLVAWGLDNYKQVSNTPVGKDFIGVAVGAFHNVALKSDGSLVAWGRDPYGIVSEIPSGNDFEAVACGTVHNVALKSDGSLVAWGSDGAGIVSNTPTGTDFRAVSAGESHSVVLKSDGSLAAWGYDKDSQVSDTPAGNDFRVVTAYSSYNVVIRGDASPPPTTYTLNTYVSPSVSGYVTKYPNKSSYNDGESVQLTATAYSGYTFSHWSGSVSGTSNPTTIIMNSNKTVTANFAALVPILPSVSITATDASAGEPSNNGSFRVSRTGTTSSSLRVYYSTGGSTALSGADYAVLPGYMDIPYGQTSAYIYVHVIDDSTVESSETVRLTISSNSAYDIGSPSYATVTVTDDDDEPPTDETIVTITAPDASVGEPTNNGSFRVNRTGDTSKKLRVYYITSGSTASSDADYESLPGYVNISAGQSSASISIDVIDDTAIEDTETVKLTIRSISTKYIVGSPSSATVTIADDDSSPPPVEKPVVTISAPDGSAGEPANDGYFRISRTGDTSENLRVYYSTSGTAFSGADYAALPGYVYILSGQSSATIYVDVIDDNETENSETVRLTISSNAAYDIGNPSYATVTITDDDDVPDPPIVDIEQMMADTLTFFYASVDNGSLVGVGVYNLYRMRWILESAYDQIVGGDYEAACGELTTAYLRCDGESDIADYVTGSATDTLAAMIQEVIDAIGCL